MKKAEKGTVKRWVQYAGIALLLTCFSGFALFWRQEGVTHAFLLVDVSVIRKILIAAFLFFLFEGALTVQGGKLRIYEVLAAFVWTVFFAVSAWVAPERTEVNASGVIGLFLRSVSFFPAACAGVRLLFTGFDRLVSPDRIEKARGCRRRGVIRSRMRWIIAGLLLVLWLRWIIGTFPGSLIYDTGSAILHFYGVEENWNNPWLMTGLYGTVIRLGDLLGNANITLFLFCGGQALLFLLVLSDLFGELWEEGLPLWLTGLLVILYGCIPEIPLYAFCMGKDSTLALCILSIGNVLLKVLTGKSKHSGRSWTCLIVLVILLPLTRNGMWIPALILLGVLFAICREKRRILAAAAAIVICMSVVMPALMNIRSAPEENLSLPLQQAARVAALEEEKLSGEERKQYKQIMPLSDWQTYESGISDPVKKRFEAIASETRIKDFFRLWLAELGAHSQTYISAAVLQNYAYLVPQAEGYNQKRKLFLGTKGARIAELMKITTLTRNENEDLKHIQDFSDLLDRTPVVRLLTGIGFYAWLLVAAMIYGLSGQIIKRYTLLLWLPFVILVGCCFSPVNGYYRYAWPMIVSVPLMTTAMVFFGRYETGCNEGGQAKAKESNMCD